MTLSFLGTTALGCASRYSIGEESAIALVCAHRMWLDSEQAKEDIKMKVLVITCFFKCVFLVFFVMSLFPKLIGVLH